jgi:hypothetical protein
MKEECCNMVSGACIGVSFRGRFRTEGKCWLEEGKKCQFLKDAVLPLARMRGLSNIISDYKFIDGTTKRISERLCECGNQLEKGKQFCEKCKIKRRRIVYKTEKQKQRGSCPTKV